MPELPEVETIRRDLEERILDIEISDIVIALPRIIKSDRLRFEKIVRNNRFARIERIGKLLVFHLASGEFMLVHLKMTGQLVFSDGKQMIAGGHSDANDPTKVPNRWTRVEFLFSSGQKLYFNDLRTFGYIKIVDAEELEEVKARFGPDQIVDRMSLEDFLKTLGKRQTSIKAILLDQRFISGLGNIYVDEVLFAAGVDPRRQGSSLSRQEAEKIYKKINPILMNAIKSRGTTFNNYVDGQGNKGAYIKKLRVYSRSGKKCLKCGSIIKKLKVAGRGTHVCGKCQI